MAEVGSRADSKPEQLREGIYSSSRLERSITVIAIAIASIGLGYLFFTQLWWKLPPDFGCRNDFTAGGLCFFLEHSVEEADASDKLLKANILESRPGSEISVPIGWATQLNAAFIENVVQPNIRWFGYLIWGTEAWIFLSMCLGFFSRLGALAAIGMSMQLMIGLAHTPNEYARREAVHDRAGQQLVVGLRCGGRAASQGSHGPGLSTIHPSAWKGDSRKFGCRGFYEVR